MHPALREGIIAHAHALILTCVALISAGFHGLIFLIWGKHPFGYDTGFYRRYLIEPFVSFPNAAVPGLGDDALIPRTMLDILRLFNLPTDMILYGSYIALFAALPVLVYLFLERTAGKPTALFSSLLIVFSPVQYNAYWYMLWKNAWGLCLLLCALIAWERRWLIPLLLVDVAVAFSHKTTAILYITTFVFVFVLDPTRRKEALAHILFTGSCFALIAFPTVQDVFKSAPQAIFLDWTSFIGLTLPFIILIAAGSGMFIRFRLPRILIALVCASLIFPLFRMPFYERVFIFTDVSLAILAGYAFAHLLDTIRTDLLNYLSIAKILTIAVSVGLIGGLLWSEMKVLGPIATSKNIQMIEELGKKVPRGATILTTSNDAPLYAGWTLSHITAPGMLRDPHDLDQWLSFWESTSTSEKIKFLGDFDSPLYISSLGELTDILGTTTIPCLEEISPKLYFNACQ